MWLYAMELARDPRKGEFGTGAAIIRIRAHRNGNGVAELHRQAMGTVGDKPAPYFLGAHSDLMRRQVKRFFADWIKVK